MFARYDAEAPARHYAQRHEAQYHGGEQTCAIEPTEHGIEVYCHECLFSVAEVAEMFETTPRNVRFWIEHGDLAAVKVGRDWVINYTALETFKRPSVGRPKETAMAKYNVLIRENADIIQEIKKLRKLQAELDAKAKQIADQIDDEFYGNRDGPQLGNLFEDQQEVERDRGGVYELLMGYEADLNDIVRRAYEDVPFAHTAQQGIAGFYREAGL